jgi:hypothetical protein
MGQVQAVGFVKTAAQTYFDVSFSNSGSGHWLCLFITGIESPDLAAISSVVDSSSTSWTDSTILNGQKIYYRENVPAGINSVRVSFSNSSYAYQCVVVERDDIVTSGSLDQFQLGYGTTGNSTWTTTATNTTSQNDEVIYGSAQAFVTGRTWTAGANFASVAGTGITGGAVEDATHTATLYLEDRTVTATGGYLANGSFSGADTGINSIVSTWKKSAGPAPQTAAPTSDISAGGWNPSTGGTLYGTIDETTADDADYDIDMSSGSTMEVKFAGLTDPASSTGHIVRYRVKGATGSLVVSLRQGAGTEIASWTHNPAPSSATTYEQTLTSGQANAITDYSDLRLRVVSAS